MRYKLILLSLFISQFFLTQTLPEFRDMLEKGNTDNKIPEQVINLAQKVYTTNTQPIYQAYEAMGYFLIAKNAFNPFKKLSNYKKGRSILESAINKDPENVEMRFYRLAIQKQSPKALNYYQNIQADTNFLSSAIKDNTDSDLVKRIKKYLRW